MSVVDDNNQYIIRNIAIDDCDYTIYVNPIRAGGRKYGDYWCLARALLERITTEQLNSIYIETKKYKKLILFNELVNCFNYDGDQMTYERNCICSVHIENVYMIRNLEKEREDGRLQLYPIGCVCIQNWKDFSAIDKQGRLDKKILEYKYKNDDAKTVRCYFCHRKTDKNKCKSCQNRSICKTAFNGLKAKIDEKRKIKANEESEEAIRTFYGGGKKEALIRRCANYTCRQELDPALKENMKYCNSCYYDKYSSNCKECDFPIEPKYKRCFNCK